MENDEIDEAMDLLREILANMSLGYKPGLYYRIKNFVEDHEADELET